jgi:Tfp pilus assembly protein PilX
MNYTAMHVRARSPDPVRRGFGTLAISMILLFVTSIGVLYANRSVLFEQRTSASQVQATLAHEVAEGALEWAAGMLNSPFDIGTDCGFLTTTNTSFRLKYVLTKFTATPSVADVVPTTTTFPGCKIDPATGTTTCNCPNVPVSGTAVANTGAAVQPSFSIAFEPVAGSSDAVRVTAYACTAQAATCSSTNFAAAGGNARLSVVMKLRPLLRVVPAAPLTCGTSCTVGGSFNLVNADVNTNGILINAGTTISVSNGTTATTLPGQPAANAMVGGDGSLSALSSPDPTCNNSQMFNAYFGTTMAKYRANPSTKVLSCAGTADCKTKIDAAYAEGWRAFYFDSDFQLSGNNTYGTAADPISVVTPNALQITGNNVFHGLIFSNNSDWNNTGTGSSTIYGAQVTCAAYKSNGNGTISYDPDVLKRIQIRTGLLVRVPGSWRDFRVNSDTLP